MTFSVGSLWFQITDAQYTAYNTATNANILHDDGAAKWLRLRLINGYDDNIVQLGESGLIHGLKSQVNRTPKESRGIEIATQESREVVFLILDALRNTVINIRDYTVVDPADVGTGYSARSMYVRSVRPVGPLISDSTTRYYTGGFTISLENTVLV